MVNYYIVVPSSDDNAELLQVPATLFGVYFNSIWVLSLGCFLCGERAVVKQLMEVAKDTRPGGPAQGTQIHFVHLSDAEDSKARFKGGIIQSGRLYTTIEGIVHNPISIQRSFSHLAKLSDLSHVDPTC